MPRRTKAEEAEERGGRVGAVAPRTQVDIRDPGVPAIPVTRSPASTTTRPNVRSIPVTQAPTPASTPTSAPAAPPVDVDTTIRERWPALAALMGVPEMAAIMREAVRGGWPESLMLVRVQQTEWWRTTPAKTRAWIGLQALDPSTAQRQIQEHKAKLDQFRRAYLVPMSEETLAKWAEDDLSGRISPDGFVNYAKEQAKSLFPSLASAIDRGITVEQYVAPYREIAARTLEISPDSIDFMDHRWNRALVNTAPTGERVSMSLSDWQTTLRSDPVYGYDRTTQARQQAAEFAEKLARTFGKVA